MMRHTKSNIERYQERRRHLAAKLDLCAFGSVLLVALATVLASAANPAACSVSGTASTGFLSWLLMVVGYVPMLCACLVLRVLDIPLPHGAESNIVLIGTCGACSIVVVWAALRLMARKRMLTFLRAGGNFMLILLCWALFQFCCYGLTATWRRTDVSRTMTFHSMQLLEMNDGAR